MSVRGCWCRPSCLATSKFGSESLGRVIIAAKQSVSFYNYSEDGEKKRIATERLTGGHAGAFKDGEAAAH